MLLGIDFVLSFVFNPSTPIFSQTFLSTTKHPAKLIKHEHRNTKSVFILILGNFYNNYLTFLGLPNQVYLCDFNIRDRQELVLVPNFCSRLHETGTKLKDS